MKPITEVIRDKELEIQRVREEMEGLLRQKEQHIKAIEAEIETLRAAAKIIADTTGQPQAAPAAAPHAPVAPVAPIAPVVESFPVQSVAASGPEPARKRWP
jgi:hypothetical protein